MTEEPGTSLTPLQRRIVDAAGEIGTAQPDEIDFLHSVLCQVGMPRRVTKERVFERRSGAALLRLEAGALYDGRRMVEQPLPYGSKPRLIMVHIGSEAVRTGQREVEIGHSARESLHLLGFESHGRAHAMTKKQIMALAACTMRLGLAQGNRAKTVNAQPIEQFEAWLGTEAGQQTMWPGTVTLSQPFFETMREYAAPLDRRALAALKQSALALDVYSWLAHRLCRINSPSGVKVYWANLRQQFGQEYGDPKNFRKAFKQTLQQVLAVYPDARVGGVGGGLHLKASRPPVPRTTTSGVTSTAIG